MLNNYARLEGRESELEQFVSLASEMERSNLKEFGTMCPGVF